MNIEKLPKWAQERMRELERQRNEAVEKLNRFTNNQTPSTTFFEEFVCLEGNEARRVWLATDRVCFLMADRGEIEVSSDGEKLRVSSHHDSICVEPRASNTVFIMEKREKGRK